MKGKYIVLNAKKMNFDGKLDFLYYQVISLSMMIQLKINYYNVFKMQILSSLKTRSYNFQTQSN